MKKNIEKVYSTYIIYYYKQRRKLAESNDAKDVS